MLKQGNSYMLPYSSGDIHCIRKGLCMHKRFMSNKRKDIGTDKISKTFEIWLWTLMKKIKWLSVQFSEMNKDHVYWVHREKYISVMGYSIKDMKERDLAHIDFLL